MEKLINQALLICSLFIITTSRLHAQSNLPTRLLRFYEDNDFLNVRGNGTDNSYTNGTRIDLFYTKGHPSRFLADRLMPKAGDSSLNIFGWSIMQVMVTPNDISKLYDQPNDYPYAGALFTTHSLYSYNEKKTYDFQTELVVGIRGPASFAEPFQVVIHQLINSQKPMGWRHQLNTMPLININFTAEKKLVGLGNFVELIGGAQLAGGSMQDAATFYSLLRIGKLVPYFKGYFSQYSGTSTNSKGKRVKTQFYLFGKPKTRFVLYNALLHGTKMYSDDPGQPATTETQRRIRHRITEVEFGCVLAHGHISMAYTQTHSTEYNKGLYHHNVGNISLYVSW